MSLQAIGSKVISFKDTVVETAPVVASKTKSAASKAIAASAAFFAATVNTTSKFVVNHSTVVAIVGLIAAVALATIGTVKIANKFFHKTPVENAIENPLIEDGAEQPEELATI